VDGSLRTLHLSTRRYLWEEIRRPRAVLVAALAAASLCLLVAGSLTSVTAVIWVSAGVWLATLLMGFGLLRTWTGRHAGETRRTVCSGALQGTPYNSSPRPRRSTSRPPLL
jgi:fatty acid desaturase